MKTIVDCLIIIALCEFLYFNLTAIPKQDYIDNNPYTYSWADLIRAVEAKLKEKNT